MFPYRWEDTAGLPCNVDVSRQMRRYRWSSMQRWCFQTDEKIPLFFHATLLFSSRWEYPNLFREMLMLLVRWQYTLLFHAALVFSWTDENRRCSSMQHWCFHGQMRIYAVLPCSIDVSRQTKIYAALPCNVDVSSRWEYTLLFHAALMFSARWQ